MHCVLDDLEKNAQKYPQRIAFEDDKGSLSWQALCLRAKQIGSSLLQLPPQSPVLIVMDKSPDCIAAMLGAIYAGCFYTPVDPDMPVTRLQMIASVLEPKCIICTQREAALSETLSNLAVQFILDDMPRDIDATGLFKRRQQMIDTDLQYVLFTSGSTGVPKGVSISHRAVKDFVEWACETLGINENVKFGNQAPLYFDNSVLDVFCALHTGACVHFIPKKHFLFVSGLLPYLQHKGINTVFWVPSVLTSAARAGVLESCPDELLDNVFFCGEIMPCRTLNAWQKALPKARYVNMYGPTEITDVCCYFEVERAFADDDSLPIGYPCANTRILLIDGEICVTGTCLSSGYYGDMERTRKVFVQNPLCIKTDQIMYRTGDLGSYNERGELMFLGRSDSQIKRHGYRIELGEIDCALNAIAGVDSGCCLFDDKSEQILCFYTGSSDEKMVKRALREKIPRYMLPDKIISRDDLPKTGNGKMDRVRIRREWESEHSLL